VQFNPFRLGGDTLVEYRAQVRARRKDGSIRWHTNRQEVASGSGQLETNVALAHAHSMALQKEKTMAPINMSSDSVEHPQT
jgi:hypothetical protein